MAPTNALSRLLRSCAGFSALETATILSAVSLLTAAAAPEVDRYIEQARMAKVISDERVIATGLTRLSWDVSRRERIEKGWAAGVLVSEGETPALGEGGDVRWTQSSGVGRLTAHLVTNDIAYATNRGAGAMLGGGWRGPYVDGVVSADPWGNRYAINVQWMAATTRFDTVVLSAGPNGLVETAFARDGVVAGGDDIVTIVSTGN